MKRACILLFTLAFAAPAPPVAADGIQCCVASSGGALTTCEVVTTEAQCESLSGVVLDSTGTCDPNPCETFFGGKRNLICCVPASKGPRCELVTDFAACDAKGGSSAGIRGSCSADICRIGFSHCTSDADCNMGVQCGDPLRKCYCLGCNIGQSCCQVSGGAYCVPTGTNKDCGCD